MGTRSLTHIKKEGLDSPTITTIYRQMDGYPGGHGQEVAKILGERKLVNGYSDAATQVNGMNCAAALLISQLKGERVGHIYVYAPDTSDVWEDYVYTLYVEGDQIMCQVAYSGGEVLAQAHVSEAWEVAVSRESEDEDAA